MKRIPLVILFADPDVASTRRLRAELRRRGARVLLAPSADEAIHQAALAPPDLLVMDMELDLGKPPPLSALFRAALPNAEILVLVRGETIVPEELRRVILFQARKPVAERELLEVIEESFPGRLQPATQLWPHRGPILCVDDDPSYLRSLSRFLIRRGYPVASFDSSERALEALPRVQPELAILDLMMPGMDGLNLAGEIRARAGEKVPIVILSALDSDETRFRSHEQGAAYYLSKPCEPERLLDVVDYLAGDLDEEERNLLRPGL